MFSGIVEEAAVVKRFDRSRSPYRLVLSSNLDHSSTKIGDSIAIDGVCLTVVECNMSELSFDISAETARRSTLGNLSVGSELNLERALKLGDRIHGHLVSGHVDGIAELISREPDGNSDRLLWRAPESCLPFIAEKGSVALAGVSLTIGEVSADNFAVYIIPHTDKITTLRKIKVGQSVNLEVDLLARYVRSNLMASEETKQNSTLDRGFLMQHGYIKD